MKIDAHQHFWKYVPSMEWITDEMYVIRKDFSPEDLEPVLKANDIDGCIAVQVDQSDEETKSLLGLADQYSFIKGVVGWIDLRADNIHEQLEAVSEHRMLKGFRHILQAEEPEFMLQPSFLNGIGTLTQYGFVYDILIYPRHLTAAAELVKQFPNQAFIIDHLAKPAIGKEGFESWEKGMTELAAHHNVYCKVSGMVTEADWKNWKQPDFLPYLDTVSEAFGRERLVFGSDWPVCLVAARYAEVVKIISDYFSADEQTAIFGDNAARFYRLT